MGKEKIDYAEIGFKCGLEIHQQLEGKKLFCQCSTANVQLKPDIFAERKLRAVVGETGIVDKAAAFEAAKGKLFLYKAHSSDCCLVELDEEPPHPINPDAVKIAVTVAKLLNAKLVDEIQVMRKIVIDGSNVTGFQRTALIALNGWIETSKGKVSIPTICLEEEAAQKIEESEKTTAYKLDRLGIPLIEIATGPEIKDPEHAKEVAEKLGLILRSVKGVKRGIGTIRQDVNLSIKGRARVEIKGFQDLDSIPKIIEYEVRRLLSLKEKNEPEVRKANPDGTTSFLRPMPGAARLYPETDIPPFKVDFEVELPELIEEKIRKYKRLGLSEDLAKKIAKVKSNLFDAALKKFPDLNPRFVADVILSKPIELRREGYPVDEIKDEVYLKILEYVANEKIAKESVEEILKKAAENKGKVEFREFFVLSESELKKELKKIVEENPGLPFKALIGKAMQKLRGKAPGKKIVEILRGLC